jgi:hypothetical protein
VQVAKINTISVSVRGKSARVTANKPSRISNRNLRANPAVEIFRSQKFNSLLFKLNLNLVSVYGSLSDD